MYLKISLSDFFTVLSTRTVGPFWERRPGGLLLAAFAFASASSTLVAVAWPFGHGVDSLSWSQAGATW